MIFLIGGKGLVGSGFSRYFKKSKIKFKIVTRKNKKNFFGKRCDILIDCNGNGSKRKANKNPFFDFSASVKSVVENLNKDTIANIWNSKANQKIEKWVRPNNCGLICKVIRVNIVVENVLSPDKGIDPNFIG